MDDKVTAIISAMSPTNDIAASSHKDFFRTDLPEDEQRALDAGNGWRYEYLNWGTFTALVLCLLPHLESFSRYKSHSSRDLNMIIQHAATLQNNHRNSPYALLQLQKAEYIGGGFETGSLQDVEPVLQLKSLRALKLKLFGLDFENANPFALEQAMTSHVERLSLEDSYLSDHALNGFLPRFTNLSSLDFTQRYDWWTGPRTRAGVFIGALYHVKHCLKSLSIRFAKPSEHVAALSTFADFTQLANLRCPVEIVMKEVEELNEDISKEWLHLLPSSLETLTLDGCRCHHKKSGCQTSSRLEALIKHKSRYVPELRRVELVRWVGDYQKQRLELHNVGIELIETDPAVGIELIETDPAPEPSG